MQLFDPGWRGEQSKGPEDWGVADFGNDPMGVVDRCGLEWQLTGCMHTSMHVFSQRKVGAMSGYLGDIQHSSCHITRTRCAKSLGAFYRSC